MSPTNLSRRGLITRAATIAAAVPAAAISLPAMAVPSASPPQHVGPTKISKLCAEHRALGKEMKAGERLQEKLMAERKQRMPKPHPSITYSKENEADGLRFLFQDREPYSMHGYIWSSDIKDELEKIELRSGPLTAEDIARRERLLARLKLSLEYEKMQEKVDRDIGFIKITRKLEDRVYPRRSDIESRIYSTPAVTRADMDAKLALYGTDESRNNWLAKKLLRDLRRLAAIAPLPTGAVQS